MAYVVNKSTTDPLYGSVWEVPAQTTPPPAWEQAPGVRCGYGDGANGQPAYYYFFHNDSSVANQTPFWEGYIRNSYEVDVDPTTSSVTAITQVLSEDDLTKFKALFPDDTKVQEVTLAQLQEHYTKRNFRGSNAEALPSGPVKKGIVSDCSYARAVVALDILFMATGAYAIASKMNASTVVKAAQLLEPVMNEMEEAFHTLADPKAKPLKKILAAKNILHVIWSGSLIEPLYKAAVQSLSWWDMVLYGTLGMAAITGALLTDGAALVALWVSEFATIAFLVTDAVHAHEVCAASPRLSA